MFNYVILFRCVTKCAKVTTPTVVLFTWFKIVIGLYSDLGEILGITQFFKDSAAQQGSRLALLHYLVILEQSLVFLEAVAHGGLEQ